MHGSVTTMSSQSHLSRRHRLRRSRNRRQSWPGRSSRRAPAGAPQPGARVTALALSFNMKGVLNMVLSSSSSWSATTVPSRYRPPLASRGRCFRFGDVDGTLRVYNIWYPA
ncbi:uncharacterized protein BDW70DRAFT_136585 [Aspergillus foveolatus]|uniref:uncharacterized protein n=1 Tax=Aspergillus foveolatus TaxID=210207 RepID=UPI003CCC907F